MQSNNLTVSLFLLGAALTVAVCGITIAGWKHRLLVWGLLALASALALAALFWEPFSAAVPLVGSAIAYIASAQMIWFLAIVAALISTVSSNLKVKRLRSSSTTDLAVIDREWKQAQELEARLQKMEGDNQQLHGELHAIREKQNAIVEDYQRMLGVEGRFEELKAQIVATRASDSLEGDQNRRKFMSIYDSLAAIYHREHMARLAAEIENLAARLSAPTTEKTKYNADEWAAWQDGEREWRSVLERWIELAECYKPGTASAVIKTPESNYRKSWSIADDQFPNSTACYEYKTFRIRHQNWEIWREEVNRVIHNVAFAGGALERAKSGPAVNALLEALSGQGPG